MMIISISDKHGIMIIFISSLWQKNRHKFFTERVIIVWNSLPSNVDLYHRLNLNVLLIKLISPLTLNAWHDQPTTLSKAYERLLSRVCVLIFAQFNMSSWFCVLLYFIRSRPITLFLHFTKGHCKRS